MIPKDGAKMRSGHFESGEQVGEWTTYDKLYDRAGKLTQVFENDPSAETQYTTDDIDAAVAALLEAKD